MVQEVDKPRFRSLSPAFNETTNSGLVILFPSDTQYAATFDLAKLYNQNIECEWVGLSIRLWNKCIWVVNTIQKL